MHLDILLIVVIGLALVALGVLLLAYKPYRTWIMTQLYLAVTSI
jgi:hypothetical protein